MMLPCSGCFLAKRGLVSEKQVVLSGNLKDRSSPCQESAEGAGDALDAGGSVRPGMKESAWNVERFCRCLQASGNNWADFLLLSPKVAEGLL